jgi:hypothetical protein
MSTITFSDSQVAVFRDKAQEEPVAFYVLDSLDNASFEVVLASETGGYYDLGIRFPFPALAEVRDEVERLNLEVFGLTADQALSLVGRSMFGGAK